MTDDEGFTLIELIVTVAMSSIVIAVLAASILVGLRTTDETQTRLSESHDAQIAAAYFVADVQSADSVFLGGAGCVEAGEAPVVALEWFDGSSVRTASYYVHSAAGERRLSRRLCTNDTSTGVTTESVQAISHNLSRSVDPSVSCDPSCGGSEPSAPSKLVITVTDESGYVFSLNAARRAE